MDKKFIKNAKLFYKYQKDGNIKKANINAKELHNIKMSLVQSNMYKDFLDNMMFHENDMVRIWACGMSIDFDYRKDESIKILKNLANATDEIICQSAKMSLYVRCNIPI